MRNRTSLDKLKKGEKAVIIDFDSHEIPAKFSNWGLFPVLK